MSENSTRIPLRVASKRAYIWDVDDIATLRSKHHICGILTGTLPHLSQQNAFLGLPLILMPEEVVLLVENDIAILIDDVHAHLQPTTEHLQRWNSEQKNGFKHQVALIEAKEAKGGLTSGRAMSVEAIQKRRAREEKKAAKLAATIANADEFTILAPDPVSSVVPAAQQAFDSLDTKSASIAHTVVIPTASSSIYWYDTSAPYASYLTITAAREAGIWNYPSTLQERARCGVFRDLWEKGYFIGGGIKFGGDYVVYPGDPLRYHSHFAASVLDSPLTPLKPMEIVAHGRLGTATKKAHLLCGWDDNKKDVSYLTIEWAGFG